jgi:hypothetical protein
MKKAEEILKESIGLEGDITEKDYKYNVTVGEAVAAIQIALDKGYKEAKTTSI